jgi:diaminohydroxyphosphoribosylaminopyrimidine deaminase / 5-amino-6-(5-phosphoribosylamino)uracil reductase
MFEVADESFMRLALRLARRAYGRTSPNPMVGAVLVKRGEVIGRGWHHRAGAPHAEIEALQDAQRRGCLAKGCTLCVTLEPCCTQGRTPPCTEAIIRAGIKKVVAATTDPNPAHAGRGFEILRHSGIAVTTGILHDEASRLNEAFNHWIVHRTPFVTVKAAMSLDGKIATSAGQSKWITGEKARAKGMRLRQGADAILVGVNTVLADDPGLTFRSRKSRARDEQEKQLRRIILDSRARTPLTAKVVSDEWARLTTVVVTQEAPRERVDALAKQVQVWVAPSAKRRSEHDEAANPLKINLRWLLRRLGSKNVTNLLIEGGGEVNGSFLLAGLARRVAFFYAPKIIGGREAPKAVGGPGILSLDEKLKLQDLEWTCLGPDLFLTARVMGS